MARSPGAIRREPVRTRPPRSLNVVADPDPAELEARVDWSAWYLSEEDDMGEGCEQGVIIRVLLTVLAQLLHTRAEGDRLWVGADNFFAWVPEEPEVRVSPDVYVLSPPPALPLPRSWQTWLPGHAPPRLAVEVVSDSDWKKDYEQNPQKYAQLGVEELVLFDPEAARAPERHPARVPLQLYVREADGAFVRRHKGAGPVPSAVLDAVFVVCPAEDPPQLRLAWGEELSLVPTEAEAREAARDAERAARDAERAALEAVERERAAREAAERELAALRVRLEQLGERGR